MDVKIGIPKALFYYDHWELWNHFFTFLGAKVCLSGETNKDILDKGISVSNSEYCLPLKVFMGHVVLLSQKVDYLFIPRYTSSYENELACPKFCALPDLVRLDLMGPNKILEAEVNLHYFPEKLRQSIIVIAEKLGVRGSDALIAFKAAYNDWLVERQQNQCASESSTEQRKPFEKSDSKCLGVYGHSYILGDKFINMGLKEKLKNWGFELLFPDQLNLNRQVLRSYSDPYCKESFWSSGIDNLGTAFYLAENRMIHGGIYITPFACGIDSIVAEIIEMRYMKKYKLPFLKLTIDEHTGEAGFNTRLEAFADVFA